MPRKSKKSLAPAWLAVEENMMTWEPMCPTPHQNGFHVARIVHGVLGRHGINPRDVPVHVATKRVYAALKDHCQHDFRGVVEAMAASWRRVGVPEGWEPVEWAVQRYRWLKRPRKAPGTYDTPDQRGLATLLWHTLCYLPPDDKHLSYAATRMLAKHTGWSHQYVAQTLKTMVSNNLLELHQPHTQATSPRYLIVYCPVYR